MVWSVCDREVCVAGGVHGRGCAWQGGVHGKQALPQQILRDTVNERAVRILLECILVELSIALRTNLKLHNT